jgi:hypothetical protein
MPSFSHRIYTLDESIEVDGRSTTPRQELGASNAQLQKCHSVRIGQGRKDDSYWILVYRPRQVSAQFPVSPETYYDI